MDNEKLKRHNETLRKYGMLPYSDLRAAYLNEDNGMSIEKKQLTVAISLLFIMFWISTVEALILFPHTMYPLFILIIPLAIVGIFSFDAIVFKESIGDISKYSVIVMLTLYVGFLFLRTGGIKGDFTIWILFVLTFTALTLRGKIRTLIVCTEVVFYVVLDVISNFHPELTVDIVAGKGDTIKTISLCEITVFIVAIIILQSRIVMDENKKNYKLQEELEAYNEELRASNDEINSINLELRSLTDQLNDALSSQKLFTAAMNHELRAPLNGVLGGIELLRDANNLDEAQIDILNAAHHSAKSMIALVNDLLDYAKLEAGEFEIIKEKFYLRDIVSQVSLLNENLAKEKGLHYIAKIADGSPNTLFGDGTRIQQIITNLLSNAIKYTKEGEVSFCLKVENDVLTIVVKDTGEGIADDAKEDLFTPFKRLNEGEHKKIQGTGLGLFVTHMLITQMEGTIQVNSKLGKGTTFTVDIPIEVLKEREESVSAEVGIMDLSEYNFLYVDDSAINVRIFRGLLEKKTGARIQGAFSGEEALEIVKENRYDVIFLDSMMPNMDGTQTLQEMRAIGVTTPIVVLTGEAGKKKEFEEAGFDGYLEKPASAEAVYGVLKDVLIH